LIQRRMIDFQKWSKWEGSISQNNLPDKVWFSKMI
jgi:hypothetical protein